MSVKCPYCEHEDTHACLKHEVVGPREKVAAVIIGGQSGPGAVPMHPDWVRSLRDQCAEAGVSFMFKQWSAADRGELRMSTTGHKMPVLDGRTHEDLPWVLAETR